MASRGETPVSGRARAARLLFAAATVIATLGLVALVALKVFERSDDVVREPYFTLIVLFQAVIYGLANMAWRRTRTGHYDEATLWGAVGGILALNPILIGAAFLARGSPERAAERAQDREILAAWRARLDADEEIDELTDAAAEAGAVAGRPHPRFGILSRIPLFLWTLIGLFGGMLVGSLLPGLAPVGAAVRQLFGFISVAAPLVIFFTLTPALVSMYQASSAGRFALYVMVGFTLTTAIGGLFALLLTVLVFPDMGLGFGAAGLGAELRRLGGDTLRLMYESRPFRAIWGSLFTSALLYLGGAIGKDVEAPGRFRRMMRSITDIFTLVGVHGVAAAGRGIAKVMPYALFLIGIFLVTDVPATLDRVRRETAGVVNPAWGSTEGYFIAVGVLVVVTVLWLVLVMLAVTAYTRFPFGRMLREYALVVYPFAWSTSSSSATIPINLESARKGLGVRAQVRDFVMPLGATVNLDGTMMSAVVTTVVAAKMVGYTPSVLDMLIALIPLVLISVGTPGTPGGMQAVAAPLLASLLPLPPGTDEAFRGVFIAFGFGLNDQFRTAVNTLDNGFLALILDKWWPTKFGIGDPPNPFMAERVIETAGVAVDGVADE